MRSRGASVAGNPVLIGAATVLVVIVAVFLSYNANAGLPFVPTYQLKVEVPSAANLVQGNEVRIGGARVGAVDTITTRRLEDGRASRVIGMKLERAVDPLPKDSTMIVRPQSVLGLKYVEITRGSSDEGYQDGDTIPLSASKPAEVEFDEFVNTFDDDTRAAIQENLSGFGDAFAGRGASLNEAIGVLPALLRDLLPVARNLADPDTGLALLPRARRRRADRRARGRDAGRAVREPRHDVHRARRGGAAVHPGLDHRGAARARRGDPLVPHPAAVPAQHRGPVPELRPGVRALRTAAPDLADALRSARRR